MKKSGCCGKPEKRCCESVIIDTLPVIIKKSGNYALKCNLTYNNLDICHIGIDIKADNVNLDLRNHVGTINAGHPGTFIRIGKYKNISISNGAIRGSIPVDNTVATDLNAIKLEGAVSFRAENLYFQDFRQGIWMPHGFLNEMISVRKCNFKDIYGRTVTDTEIFEELLFFSISLGGFQCKGIIIEDCQFIWDPLGGPDPTTGNPGIAFVGFNAPYNGIAFNGIIKNCNFIEATTGILWFPQGENHGTLLIENVNILMSNRALTFTFYAGMILCCSDVNCLCPSIKVTNCTIGSNGVPLLPYDGIGVPSARSCIIDGCSFSLPNIAPFYTCIYAGLADVGSAADNIIIRNCAFSGTCSVPNNNASLIDAIVLFKARGALIEHNQFTDSCNTALTVTSFQGFNPEVTIMNNVFSSNPGIAVNIDSSVTGTIIQGNIFKRNGVGVNLNATSSNTVVSGNTLHLNGQNIVSNGSVGNFIINNLETSPEPQAPCVTCSGNVLKMNPEMKILVAKGLKNAKRYEGKFPTFKSYLIEQMLSEDNQSDRKE